MRNIRVSLAAALVAGGASVAFAHLPRGQTYYAFQFPANAVPVIDGDLSEWNMVPGTFEVSLENGLIKESVRGDAGNDPSDFNARAIWAWNDEANRVYSMASVVDDNLHNNRNDPGTYLWDDDWNFVLDADHSGGEVFDFAWASLPQDEVRQRAYTTGRLWSVMVPPIDGFWVFTFIEGTDWMTTGRELPFPEYVEVGWSRTGTTGGPGTYTYEIKMTPWEHWDWDGPAQSTVVDLEPGMVIHCGSSSKDYDNNDGRYDGDYDFPPTNAVWHSADALADFVLLPVDETLFPTAVEQDSWGRIKSRILAQD